MNLNDSLEFDPHGGDDSLPNESVISPIPWDSSDEESIAENLTFLEGSGWVNDYGEVVRPVKRPEAHAFPNSRTGIVLSSKATTSRAVHHRKRDVLRNWEDLKAMYDARS